MAEWVKRWGYEFAAKPQRPGIYRLRSGGYLVRGRVTDPRTGKRRETMRATSAKSLQEAQRDLDNAVESLRSRLDESTTAPTRWKGYAVSLLETKIARGDITSPAEIERWKQTLANYLIPEFGEHDVREVRREHINAWLRGRVMVWMRDGRPSLRDPQKTFRPTKSTANGWLRILRTICREARIEFRLDECAFDGVRMFDEEGYSASDPNAVDPRRLRSVLPKLEAKYPDRFAMIWLGFVTAARPSTLRPLRKSGPDADGDWKARTVKMRRSNARGQRIVNRTKTRIVQEIPLDKYTIDVLRRHVARQSGEAAESEFLFPSSRGGMLGRNALAEPFAWLAQQLKMPRLTPRAMRRTFADMARQAGLSAVVRTAITGHKTDEMDRHYQTVGIDEARNAVTRVSALARGGGKRGGDRSAKNKRGANG